MFILQDHQTYINTYRLPRAKMPVLNISLVSYFDKEKIRKR